MSLLMASRPARDRVARSGLATAWVCVAVFLALQGSAPVARGEIYPSAAANTTALAGGATLANGGYLVAETSVFNAYNASFTSSAVPIAPNLVMFAAHEITGSGVTADSAYVTVGANFNATGATKDQITKFFVVPGYDGTFNNPDAVIAVLANDLPFQGVKISSTLPVAGSTQMLAGFGYSAVSGGTPIQDGYARAWTMGLANSNDSDVSAAYYRTGASTARPDTGNAYSSDSGGLVLDPTTNQMTGLIVGQNGGNALPGDTAFLNLTVPSTEQWWQSTVDAYADGGPNLDTAASPEPSSLAFVAAGVAPVLSMQRRRSGRR